MLHGADDQGATSNVPVRISSTELWGSRLPFCWWRTGVLKAAPLLSLPLLKTKFHDCFKPIYMGAVPRRNTGSQTLLSQVLFPWQHKHLRHRMISLILGPIQLETTKKKNNQVLARLVSRTCSSPGYRNSSNKEGNGSTCPRKGKEQDFALWQQSTLELPWGGCGATNNKETREILPGGRGKSHYWSTQVTTLATK